MDFDHPVEGLVFEGQAELHNAKALAMELDIGATAKTAELICAAYARWGSETPSHLEGQFAFLIRDGAGAAFACRDHLGTLPFFYRREGSRLQFAGDMRTFLDRHRPERVLNARMLVALALPQVLSPVEGETYHRGIFSLPPGTSMVSSRHGETLRRYWRPEPIPIAGDVLETARELVIGAVRNRIARRNSVALLVSGGLDSSLIAGVAADLLQSSDRRLIGLSVVNDPSHAAIPDERPWMSKLEGMANLDMHYVDAAGAGPLDGIEDPRQFETSPRINLPHFYRPAVEAACDLGADVLLSGNFGEMTVSARPKHLLLHLLAAGKWDAFHRELALRSELSGRSRLVHLAAELAAWLRPKRIAESAMFLRRDFLRDNPLPPAPPPSRSLDPADQAVRDLNDVLARDALRSVLAPDHLLAISQPFQDRKLVEFCLSLPAGWKARDGYSRYLARRLLAESPASPVAWRRGKMWATPDYYQRFNRQLDTARQFVRSIRNSDPVREIVDMPRLQSALKSASTANHRDVFVRIPATLQLIAFLRQF